MGVPATMEPLGLITALSPHERFGPRELTA